LSLRFLKKLVLSSNSITRLTYLPVTLENLNLSNNNIFSLEGLEKLTRLYILDISCNQVESLKPLQNCSSIRCLYASHNRVSSMQGLERHPQLLEVELEGNQIVKRESLESLNINTAICVVNLKGNPVQQ